MVSAPCASVSFSRDTAKPAALLVLLFSVTHTTQLEQGQWPAVLKPLIWSNLNTWTQRQTIPNYMKPRESIESPHQRISRSPTLIQWTQRQAILSLACGHGYK